MVVKVHNEVIVKANLLLKRTKLSKRVVCEKPHRATIFRPSPFICRKSPVLSLLNSDKMEIILTTVIYTAVSLHCRNETSTNTIFQIYVFIC